MREDASLVKRNAHRGLGKDGAGGLACDGAIRSPQKSRAIYERFDFVVRQSPKKRKSRIRAQEQVSRRRGRGSHGRYLERHHVL